jgi:hypothetical protein
MSGYGEDRYEPLPGLLGLPGFLLGKLSRRVRAGLLVVGIVFLGVVVVAVVPAVRRARNAAETAEQRAHAAAVARERRRLREDQRPHFAPLGQSSLAAAQLEAQITLDSRKRAEIGSLPGPPVHSTRCRPAKRDRATEAAEHAGGRLFDCLAMTSPTLGFEFVAVVDYRRRMLTWCKTNSVGLTGSKPLATVPLDRACSTVDGSLTRRRG